MIRYKYTKGDVSVTAEVETMAQLFEYIEWKDENKRNEECKPPASPKRHIPKLKIVYLNGVISYTEDPNGLIHLDRVGGPLMVMSFNKEDVSIEEC